MGELGGAMKAAGDAPAPAFTPKVKVAVIKNTQSQSTQPVQTGSGVSKLIGELGGAMKAAGDAPNSAPAAAP